MWLDTADTAMRGQAPGELGEHPRVYDGTVVSISEPQAGQGEDKKISRDGPLMALVDAGLGASALAA